MKKIIPVALVLAVLGGVGAYYFFRPKYDDALKLSGTVQTREVRLGSKVGGRVSEVIVQEGALVRAGSVLVRLEAAELQAQQQQLEARLAMARAEAAKLGSGYRPEEIQQADANARREQAALEALRQGPRTQEVQQALADHSAAQADAANAESSFKRVEQLSQSGDISAQALDDARARRDAQAGRAEALRQRLELLQAGSRQEDVRAGEARHQQALASAQLMKSGYRKEDIASASARVREIEGLLQELSVRLAEAEVRAPGTCGEGAPGLCRVEVVDVRPGDLVAANRAVVTLLEPTELWVRVYVPEPQLGRVQVGQKALVKIDTFPDRTFDGTIEQISSQGEFLPRNIQTRDDRNHQVFGVKVRVDNSSGALKSGMAADVELSAKAG